MAPRRSALASLHSRGLMSWTTSRFRCVPMKRQSSRCVLSPFCLCDCAHDTVPAVRPCIRCRLCTWTICRVSATPLPTRTWVPAPTLTKPWTALPLLLLRTRLKWSMPTGVPSTLHSFRPSTPPQPPNHRHRPPRAPGAARAPVWVPGPATLPLAWAWPTAWAQT